MAYDLWFVERANAHSACRAQLQAENDRLSAKVEQHMALERDLLREAGELKARYESLTRVIAKASRWTWSPTLWDWEACVETLRGEALDAIDRADAADARIKELEALLPLWQLFTKLAERSNLSAPEVALEEDGELGLDWEGGARHALTLSLRRDGRVSYAALLGEEAMHGHFQWPDWPEDFQRLLQRFAGES